MPHHTKNEIEIMGFRAVIEDLDSTLSQVKDISSQCTLQLMDAQAVAGKKHVLHATRHALKAFQREYNIAHNLGMEICLRTSAQRQISKAMEILGLKEGEREICAVLVGCEEEVVRKLEDIFHRDDQVLIPQEKVLSKIYDLTPQEIQSSGDLTALIMEKTTLLLIDQ